MRYIPQAKSLWDFFEETPLSFKKLYTNSKKNGIMVLIVENLKREVK